MKPSQRRVRVCGRFAKAILVFAACLCSTAAADNAFHVGVVYAVGAGHYHGYRPCGCWPGYYPCRYGDWYDASPYLHDYAYADPGAEVRRHWRALAAKHYRDALNGFREAVQNDPDNADAMIGFALATAAFGDLRGASVALRRAVVTDPDSLNLLLDRRIVPIAMDLLRRYRNYRSYNLSPRDASFMRAALHYLLGDRARAGTALSPEDRSASASSFRQLLAGR